MIYLVNRINEIQLTQMKVKNEIYIGANNRRSLIDIEIPEGNNNELVLFVHGYKGYKDWGAWNIVQKEFVKNGIGFVKINLSHNGGTVENPIDFPDLKAFGENRYTYEIEDIISAIDFISKKIDLEKFKLTLIGHSRGGGDAILAGSHPKVDRVITWAGIDDIPSRFPKGEELKKWKENGVRYIKNGRTKQDMPHFYSFYEDYLDNKSVLDIKSNAKNLNIPTLHIHGEKDEAVSSLCAENLQKWTGGDLLIIENTGHTFGTKHPWHLETLPDAMQKVVDSSVKFILD